MSDDYLWSKSGPPDPETARLERLLSSYAHRGGPAPPPPAKSAHGRALALAACAFLTASAAWLLTRGSGERWTLAAAEDRSRQVRAGEWIETGPEAATLRMGGGDEIRIEANSRLRVDRTTRASRRLRMERGEITATIFAPARTLFIDTPSAAAVDLGCKYVLSVDEQGDGLLRVVLGWVGFEHQGREVFIPEHAYCRTKAGVGPGTPWYEDSSEAFRKALDRLDFSGGGTGELAVALAEARPRDAVSLWHLLASRPGSERGRIYDSLARLAPPPPGVTREGIVNGDPRMRDRWWNALGLENIDWWRKWKGEWARN
jgi:hypothetical protein